MASGYMGSAKGGITGPVCNTAQGAADEFFARYPKARQCSTSLVREAGETGLVVRDYATPSVQWVRAKPHAVNALN